MSLRNLTNKIMQIHIKMSQRRFEKKSNVLLNYMQNVILGYPDS